MSGDVPVAVYVRISYDRYGKRHGVSDQTSDVTDLIERTPQPAPRWGANGHQP